ncbi:hypothetical protein [Nitrosomonas cryotolerans]|uniref:hypothetical protein n=1 Tax=Nitrosomonas cryotolerans TaxID=44575 RepID=UPI0011600DF5|nr:hypothetical protein [Nitrosomonas cryotolerans]
MPDETTSLKVSGNRLLIKVTRDSLPRVKDKYRFINLLSSSRPWGCFQATLPRTRLARVFPTPVGRFSIHCYFYGY